MPQQDSAIRMFTALTFIIVPGRHWTEWTTLSEKAEHGLVTDNGQSPTPRRINSIVTLTPGTSQQKYV